MGIHRSIGFLSFFVATLLVICHVNAQDHPEQPLRNVNLAPVWMWRSAYWCLQNTTKACTGKDILKLDGVVNVTKSELPEYCKAGGCRYHTLDVLQCISWVHRDFWFANKNTTKQVADAINDGCTKNQAITTPPPPKK